MGVIESETGTTQGLMISEVFGPTMQGEGPHLGERAAFIRFGGCNLHCSWCDTPYTWDASRFNLRTEISRRDEDEIADQVGAMLVRRVVITGGEPLLHQKQPAFDRLLRSLFMRGLKIEVETNGTIMPSETAISLVEQFNVSPKLDQGDPLDIRIRDDVLTRYADLAAQKRAVLKIVCRDADDVIQARNLADRYAFPHDRVYAMPEGITAVDVVATTGRIADAVIEQDLNLTTRLHVLAWGTERGR